MIAAQKSAPLPGTRPEGARDEREAAAHVQQMFARIAPRYDFLNHLLSFSLDRVWRRRTARRFLPILRRPDARVLDLCCGTGDLAFALARARNRAIPQPTASCPDEGRPAVPNAEAKSPGQRPDTPASSQRGLSGGRSFSSDKSLAPASGVSTPEGSVRYPIIGSDFVEGMLTRARQKAAAGSHAAAFAAADALHLPFPDATFDLVTSAFGFRNLANYEHGLREIARVLKPGGEVGVLEFTEPGSGPLAALFRFYFRHILPRIGGAISGDADAYAYLPGSVARFPSPAGLAALMEQTGFAGVRIASWNFGSVVLHSARRA